MEQTRGLRLAEECETSEKGFHCCWAQPLAVETAQFVIARQDIYNKERLVARRGDLFEVIDRLQDFFIGRPANSTQSAELLFYLHWAPARMGYLSGQGAIRHADVLT